MTPVAAGGATLLCLSALMSAAPTAGATTARTELAGTAVPAAVRAHPAGSVAKSSTVSFELVLNLRNESGAQALLKAVSDPTSASYRHYVNAGEWEAQFSPTAAQVTQATKWLQSERFRVGAVSKDRMTISATGTAAQVESAFGTGLANYQVAGHVTRYATSNLSVPASLDGIVAGAMGIDQHFATPAYQTGQPTSLSSTPSAPAKASDPFPPPPAAFVTAPPCSTSYGGKSTKTGFNKTNPGYPASSPDVVCGYVPTQFRSAYDLTSSETGAGETVAIVDAYGSDTIQADATEYFQKNAPTLPLASSQFSQIDATPFDDQGECAASGWADEQAIDVEAVHSTAPGANILYMGAQDCVNGLFNADQDVIDNGLANVVTNSWGDTGGDLLDDVSYRTAFDNLLMMAGSTGITTLYSSGDDGDNFNELGVSAANYPASSPYTTAVGGTTLQIGAAGQQTGQLGWATGRSFKCTANIVGDVTGCTSGTVGDWLPASLDGASGGFTSYNYSEPYYQTPVVPSSLSLRNDDITGEYNRVMPDISLDADPGTGFLIGLHETFPSGKVSYGQTRYGGTSLASPLLAGVVADADQTAGVPVGFINPAIYRLDQVSTSAIQDIVPGGLQSQYRRDYADEEIGGATGLLVSIREIGYSGNETYCDETGNCATRPFTLSTATGYDSLTGLGSIGTTFVTSLADY
jgi:subtilase family serine protease